MPGGDNLGVPAHDPQTSTAALEILNGGAGNNRLPGGPGRNWLWGSYGVDNLIGGSDADRMFGRLARDIMVGAQAMTQSGAASGSTA